MERKFEPEGTFEASKRSSVVATMFTEGPCVLQKEYAKWNLDLRGSSYRKPMVIMILVTMLILKITEEWVRPTRAHPEEARRLL